MKKSILAFSALLLFAACGSDKTELSFKNSTDSEGPIKEIIWAEGDANWGEEEVAENSVSSSKEVNETTGRIECAVDDGSGFGSATIASESTGTETVSIDEGSSNVVTITATK